MKKENSNNLRPDKNGFDSTDEEHQFDIWQAGLNKELLSFWKSMLE